MCIGRVIQRTLDLKQINSHSKFIQEKKYGVFVVHESLVYEYNHRLIRIAKLISSPIFLTGTHIRKQTNKQNRNVQRENFLCNRIQNNIDVFLNLSIFCVCTSSWFSEIIIGLSDTSNIVQLVSETRRIIIEFTIVLNMMNNP